MFWYIYIYLVFVCSAAASPTSTAVFNSRMLTYVDVCRRMLNLLNLLCLQGFMFCRRKSYKDLRIDRDSPEGIEVPWTRTSAYVSVRQHTSAYVSIRQHTSAYVSIRSKDLRIDRESRGYPSPFNSVAKRLTQKLTQSRAAKFVEEASCLKIVCGDRVCDRAGQALQLGMWRSLETRSWLKMSKIGQPTPSPFDRLWKWKWNCE